MVAMLVCQTVQTKISQCKEIHDPQMINPTEVGDPLTLRANPKFCHYRV